MGIIRYKQGINGYNFRVLYLVWQLRNGVQGGGMSLLFGGRGIAGFSDFCGV